MELNVLKKVCLTVFYAYIYLMTVRWKNNAWCIYLRDFRCPKHNYDLRFQIILTFSHDQYGTRGAFIAIYTEEKSTAWNYKFKSP